MSWKLIKFFFKILWYTLKIPYYLIKGIVKLTRKANKKVEEQKVTKKRGKLLPRFEELSVVETIKGDYKKWIHKMATSDSQIGIILGARGSGKTAIGMKLLENLHTKTKKNCFALGFKKESLPLWINVADDIKDIKNNSLVLIDEGGILFNSRDSMSNANKLLSDLILIARHKNLTILFISQNSANLEVNILRQADALILKPSSLLQKEFERTIIQKLYTQMEDKFESYADKNGLAYIYAGNFQGFVTNKLPSFWAENVSKGFK